MHLIGSVTCLFYKYKVNIQIRDMVCDVVVVVVVAVMCIHHFLLLCQPIKSLSF